jgi:hypothetical protein
MNYLPGLASNLNPLDLCLLSSWDYRGESPAPASLFFFFFIIFVSCLNSSPAGQTKEPSCLSALFIAVTYLLTLFAPFWPPALMA